MHVAKQVFEDKALEGLALPQTMDCLKIKKKKFINLKTRLNLSI